MSAPRGGLGKGLGALIPTSASEHVSRETGSTGATAHLASGAPAVPRASSVLRGVSLINAPLDAIRSNPRQPRQHFEPEALAELVVSLREVGVLQPIVVRTDPQDRSRYELVMGERRWRAAQQAGLTHIPAILRETSDDDLLRDALIENLHRAQLNPLEEGAAYQQLLEEFGVTHDELATRIGRSRSQVTNMIRLLGLPPAVQRRVAAGVLSAGHARALLALTDPGLAEAMANRIVAEGLSVRSVEELVSLEKGAARPRAARSQVQRVEPVADEMAEKLSDHLETRVHIEWGRAKSRLIVEVADIDDLERVAGLILSERKDSGVANRAEA